MNNVHLPSVIVGFLLLMLVLILTYGLLYIPNSAQLSQLISDELNKQTNHNNGMRRYAILAKKISGLESTITTLLNNRQGNYGVNAESPVIISLFEKIHKIEKTLTILELSVSTNNNNVEQLTASNNKPELSSEAAEKSSKAYYQSLEDNFQSEPADTQWSLAMNDKIKNSVEIFKQNNTESSTSIIDMDCKSTLCRVELSYDRNTNMNEHGMSMLGILGDDFGGLSSQAITDSNGNISKIVYYLSR